MYVLAGMPPRSGFYTLARFLWYWKATLTAFWFSTATAEDQKVASVIFQYHKNRARVKSLIDASKVSSDCS